MVSLGFTIFLFLEWNSADWNERKQECAARVQAVRAALNGRGTKIALVLIQRNEMTPPAVGSEESTGKTDDFTSFDIYRPFVCFLFC